MQILHLGGVSLVTSSTVRRPATQLQTMIFIPADDDLTSPIEQSSNQFENKAPKGLALHVVNLGTEYPQTWGPISYLAGRNSGL